MELNQILALRLRALMDLRPDLDTQTKLALRTGVSQSTVQRILRREVHTSLDIVAALAQAFGVAAQSLVAPIEGDQVQMAPNADEHALLSAWRKLGIDEHHRIMSYIGITLVAAKSCAVRITDVKLTSTQKAPAAAIPAAERASARGVSANGLLSKPNAESKKTANKR